MRYHINIFWSDEDGQYIGDIPDLRFCSASGASPQEALAEVLIAQELWMENAQEMNRKIPEPRYRPGALAN